MCWLEGMVGKVPFQLEEGMEPFAVAGKDGRPFMQDGEGGCLRCRHGFEFHILSTTYTWRVVRITILS